MRVEQGKLEIYASKVGKQESKTKKQYIFHSSLNQN